MRLRYAPLIAIAGLALGGLAGCGSPSSPVATPPSVGSPAGPSVGSAGGAAPSGAQSPGASEPEPSGSVTAISGTVQAGVEPGCVLLNTGAKTYLLIGGDRTAMKSGAKLTVYGTPEPGMLSTCQQGTPFRVSRVEG